MADYNERRTNQGKRCQGKTPMETSLEGRDLYDNLVHAEETLEVESYTV